MLNNIKIWKNKKKVTPETSENIPIQRVSSLPLSSSFLSGKDSKGHRRCVSLAKIEEVFAKIEDAGEEKSSDTPIINEETKKKHRRMNSSIHLEITQLPEKYEDTVNHAVEQMLKGMTEGKTLKRKKQRMLDVPDAFRPKSNIPNLDMIDVLMYEEASITHLKYYIEKNLIDVNSKDKNGYNLLQAAIISGCSYEDINFLLTYNADPNECNGTLNAVHWAFLLSKSLDIVYLLRRHGGKLLTPTGCGQTPMHLCVESCGNRMCSKEKISKIKLNISALVDEGMTGYETNINGDTILHGAVDFASETPSLLNWIILTFPDIINIRNNDGMNAMFLASAHMKNIKSIRVLLHNDGDYKARTNFGDNALEYSEIHNPEFYTSLISLRRECLQHKDLSADLLKSSSVHAARK